MKIYIPHKTNSGVNGGNTFIRNITNGLSGKVEFVDTVGECDILFIASPMAVEKIEVYLAKKSGKQVVLRVDNIPRKSRNKRNTPHERMKEFASLADVVIYQSEWARDYCYPLCGLGTVIYNGVDTKVFYPPKDPKENLYLFAYHGKNEHKGFWHAHYIFQKEFRKNPEAWFYFIYDFRSELQELADANFDFWNGEHYLHHPIITDPEAMANLMRRAKYFIYPSICDASPNVVLEARACGCEVIGYLDKTMSGTAELLDPKLDISLERMCEEYLAVFNMVLQTNEPL
jgi:glycosyltransferase involved in cell wall biosynthesis